jgi:hypothetical protein
MAGFPHLRRLVGAAGDDERPVVKLPHRHRIHRTGVGGTIPVSGHRQTPDAFGVITTPPAYRTRAAGPKIATFEKRTRDSPLPIN